MWDVDFSITFPLAYLNFLLEKKEDMLNSYEDFTTLDPIYDKVWQVKDLPVNSLVILKGWDTMVKVLQV